ncbi:MAG: hypothetical protein ACI3XM_05030, partial [Eubacteriales bacterium]
MKKNKKKTASAPTKEQDMHKGDVTQEMDAIMEAASEDGAAAESSVLLNAEPATEESAAAEPANEEPEIAEPAGAEPAHAEPAAADTDEHAAAEPVRKTDTEAILQPCENNSDTGSTAAADTEAEADAQPIDAHSEETETEDDAASGAIEAAEAATDADAVSTQESEAAASPEADKTNMDINAAADHSDTEEAVHAPKSSTSGVSRETSSKEASSADADPEETEKAPSYKKLGLYLHVPFCKSKCAYCDFYSTDKIVCRGGGRAPEEMKLYTNALKNHMRILSERTTQYNVDTIFIGGGTPTALPEKLLLDIVKEV